MENIQFEEVYQKYYKKIFLYIKRRISSIEDSEDLTEEIFINFYKSISSYKKEKSSLEVWLFTITNNRLKNYYRDKKNEVLTDEMESKITAYEYSAEQVAFLFQMREELLWALHKLSERERIILIKKYYQGKKSNEIAEEIQVTPGNVRVIAKRSLSKLKKILNERLDYE